MYKESNVKVPSDIAGIMLAGILSDTLALTSPTTTSLDREAVEKLSKLAKVDYKKFSIEMFKVGTSLEGKTIEEIVNTDIKEFVSDGTKFSVSQVFTLDIDSIFNKKEEFIFYINKLAADRNYKLVLLVVTDIINNGSYLLYNEGLDEVISDSFNIRSFEGYFVGGMVSRKKQIVPKLMDVIR